jgi:hypothetical protein
VISIRGVLYSEYVAEKEISTFRLTESTISTTGPLSHQICIKDKRLKKMISFKGLVLGKELI